MARTPNDDFKEMLVLAEQEENPDVRLGMFRAVAHLSVKFNDGMIAELMTDLELPNVKDGAN